MTAFLLNNQTLFLILRANSIAYTMKDERILDITENVKWIGILDRDIVTFDIVMETQPR